MEGQNLDTIEEAYEALFHNDIPTLLDMLADSVDWLMPGPPNILSYAGPRRGRRQVAAFFEALHENEEVELFRAKEFIEGENKIIVLGDYRARVKSTGRMISLQWAHVLTICHGKIDRWGCFFDTAAVVAAYTRTAAQRVASVGSPGRGWGVSQLLCQRLKREDPKEYEEEQRRAREWALRLLDSKKRNNEKESTGLARSKSGS